MDFHEPSQERSHICSYVVTLPLQTAQKHLEESLFQTLCGEQMEVYPWIESSGW
jgi:hypothetical protein